MGRDRNDMSEAHQQMLTAPKENIVSEVILNGVGWARTGENKLGQLSWSRTVRAGPNQNEMDKEGPE